MNARILEAPWTSVAFHHFRSFVHFLILFSELAPTSERTVNFPFPLRTFPASLVSQRISFRGLS
jgi:hypothetical protein